MSNLQIICELCCICEKLVMVVQSQSEALALQGVIVMEEERAEALGRYHALLGHDEVPDEMGGELE